MLPKFNRCFATPGIFYEKVTELLLINNISNVMDKLISNASGW